MHISVYVVCSELVYYCVHFEGSILISSGCRVYIRMVIRVPRSDISISVG